MKDLYNKIIGSFDTHTKNSFSARKLTSFALMPCVYYLHYRYVDMSNSISFLVADLLAILLFLGIVTFEQVIKFKNGESDKPQVNQLENEQQG